MKIYFGRITDPDLIESAFLYDKEYFEYEVELFEEYITIKDACKRVMPISYEYLDEFINTTAIIDHYTKHWRNSRKELERIRSDEVRTA